MSARDAGDMEPGGRPHGGEDDSYFRGHRRNPLTTSALGGRILSASQLPWFLLTPPRGFGVLTTTGRRTGRKRRRCMRVIREGDRAYLVSLRGERAAWMHNVRANPNVRVRLRGGSYDAAAREIVDASELDRARSIYCGTVNRFDRIEYRMHRSGTPTPDRIRSLHEQWFSVGTPLVLELAEPEKVA